MIIKLSILLLIVVMVLGMLGKLRPTLGRPKIQNAVKCPDCGVYLIGNGVHDCPGRK